MKDAQGLPGGIGKQRVEALSDGLYAIALTLLVLDLKLPPLGEAATNADLLHALRQLTPKVLTWLLSFLVMAVLWLSQVRVYRLVHSLSRAMVRLELAQLAFVSLMPFSTALIGEHGNLPAAAIVYAGNMLAITLTGAWRTRELLNEPRVHVEALATPLLRTLKVRAYALPACAAAAFALGFFSGLEHACDAPYDLHAVPGACVKGACEAWRAKQCRTRAKAPLTAGYASHTIAPEGVAPSTGRWPRQSV